MAEGVAPSLKSIPHSNRLKSEIRELGRAHTRIANVHANAQKKHAAHIRNTRSRVAYETHGTQFMLSNRRLGG